MGTWLPLPDCLSEVVGVPLPSHPPTNGHFHLQCIAMKCVVNLDLQIECNADKWSINPHNSQTRVFQSATLSLHHCRNRAIAWIRRFQPIDVATTR
ncbi:MAG TPA: hypothetical protein DEF45_15910 [Rhodopirellula sp.]|nr:hypothetical protein [Rhodopirellula sp.]